MRSDYINSSASRPIGDGRSHAAFAVNTTVMALGKILKKAPVEGSLIAQIGSFVSLIFALFLWLFFAVGVSLASEKASVEPPFAFVMFIVAFLAVLATFAMFACVRANGRSKMRKVHRNIKGTGKAPVCINYNIDGVGVRCEYCGVEDFFQWQKCFSSYYLDNDVLVLRGKMRTRLVIPCIGECGVDISGLADMLDSAGLCGKRMSPSTSAADRAKRKGCGKIVLWSAAAVAALIVMAIVVAAISSSNDRELPYLWTSADKGVSYRQREGLDFREMRFPEGSFAIAIPMAIFPTNGMGGRIDYPLTGDYVANRHWIYLSQDGSCRLDVSYVRKNNGANLVAGAGAVGVAFGQGCPVNVLYCRDGRTTTLSALATELPIRDVLGNVDVIEACGGVRDGAFMRKHGADGCSFFHALIRSGNSIGRSMQAIVVRGNEAWRIHVMIPSFANRTADAAKAFVIDSLPAGEIIGSFRILDALHP